MARQTRASAASHASSSGAEQGHTTSKKTRRAHRKSRNGCIECKNRHIRCDERQPSCANCEAAERTCSYPPPKTGTQTQKHGHPYRTKPKQQLEARSELDETSELEATSGLGAAGAREVLPDLDTNLHRTLSPASSTQLLAASNSSANHLPGLSNVLNTVPEAIYTPQHMLLLRHADTVPNLTAPHGSIVDIAVRHAVDSSYLLDEILAFTAFHMAHVYPGSGVHLQNLATELQNRALASFTRLTEIVPNDDEPTAVPRFLFSAMLGRHVLSDTLAHHCSDFHDFIDRFVDCVNLNRGIRAVTPAAQQFLYNSELQPFLKVVIEARNKIFSPGNECDPLRRLMDDSSLSEDSAQSCRQAIEGLQKSFDMCRVLEEEEYPQSVSTFSVFLEAGFLGMLRKHQPEALIILAFYGVLLHRCRSFWAFCNAGAPIIRGIAAHVGSYWQEALAWPLYVLETEYNSTTS